MKRTEEELMEKYKTNLPKKSPTQSKRIEWADHIWRNSKETCKT